MKYLRLLLLILPLLACGGGAALIGTPMPPVVGKTQWTCPTPAVAVPTPIAGEPTTVPLATATPYVRGDMAFLGQDSYAGSLRITVHAVTTVGSVAADQGGGVLRLVELELASAQALPLDLAAQVVIREVVQADGSGSRGWWRTDARAQGPYGDLPTQVPAGGSWRGQIAIRTPDGTPTLVAVFRTPDDARISDAPTDGLVLVRVARDPFCQANIVRPVWTPGDGGGPGPIDGTPVAVPPGANALVAFVVAHLGYPYVWGAKGPNAFDCSGLMYAAYASIGISIPAGTRGGPPPGQGFFGTALTPAQLRPGDLIFFQITGDTPSHVGMYVGDLDGDGRGDMIHAATPELGVIFESNVFGSAFWTRVYWGARRMPGFPYL